MRLLTQLSFVAACSISVVGAYASPTHPSFATPSTSLAFDGWNQLNRAGMGGGDQTAATAAFVAGFSSNVEGSGDAVLKRLSGTVYPAGAGLYGSGVIELADATVPAGAVKLDLQGILNDFSASFGTSSIALNYNGGTQAIAPALESFASTGGVADYWHFSWDLAALGTPVTSYNVTVTLPFSQTLALETNAVAVPEPTGLAALSLIGLIARRRR